MICLFWWLDFSTIFVMDRYAILDPHKSEYSLVIIDGDRLMSSWCVSPSFFSVYHSDLWASRTSPATAKCHQADISPWTGWLVFTSGSRSLSSWCAAGSLAGLRVEFMEKFFKYMEESEIYPWNKHSSIRNQGDAFPIWEELSDLPMKKI